MAGEQERLREAVVDLVLERGYHNVTFEDVAEKAGIEGSELDGLHFDMEKLYVTVFEENSAAFEAEVLGAFEAEGSWRDGLRACAYAAARFVRDHPREVSFGAIQMFAAGDMAQVSREAQLQRMVDLVDLGRQELDDPEAIGRGVAEGVIGSIYALLLKELQGGRGVGSAIDFVPEMMYIAVRPYLGHEVAREELTIPPPPSPSGERADRVRARYGHAVSEAAVPGDKGALRLARLPPGRHGLPREFVTKNQRDRLTAGTIAVVAARGLHDATITQICAAAGVSRRTFYGYFSSKEECFFSAYDTVLEHLRAATDAASSEETEWPRQVAAKLLSTLEFFALNPDLARFCLVAPQRAGDTVAGRYRKAVGAAVAYLCQGMPPPPATRAPSEAVAASLIGGMMALVVRKVEAGEGEDLPQLLPDLLELFLAPYLGRAEAVEVARKPT